jgi:soluble cytochrome b562
MDLSHRIAPLVKWVSPGLGRKASTGAWGATALLLCTACGGPSTTNSTPQASGPPAPTAESGVESAKAQQEKQQAEARQQRQKLVDDLRQGIEQSQRLAESEKWDELATSIDSLRKQAERIAAENSTPANSTPDDSHAPGTDAQALTDQIVALEKLLEAGQARLAEKARAEQLDKARQWVAAGRIDDAQQALREILTRGPTDEQRESAQMLTQEIERLRKARRQLKSWLTMLASGEERDVQAAQTQLLQDPDTATGMILESLRGAKDEKAAAAYLDTLRQLGRSDVVVPALLEMLKEPERKTLWPLFTRELPQLAGPEAGPSLLNLALQTQDDSQRLAALGALATTADPPAESFLALAARLEPTPAARPEMLRVMTRCALKHGQRDLWALRGLTEAADVDKTIARLPEILRSWYSSATNSPRDNELAWEARRLAVVLGLEFGAPFTGVKVERAEADSPEGPATAAVDGVWNSLDPKTQWRYPADKRGSLLLDLGQDRMVTAVRIWNWNEAGGVQRGWKEVEIFVSETPSELTPVATIFLLPAPGLADSPDFGVLIPIAAVKGRYVRLQAKSTWAVDSHSGLAEVQVSGF